MSAPTKRSCSELGLCQSRKVPCLDCDRYPWPEPEESVTPMEQIAAWAITTAVLLITIATLFGIAGFVYVRWFATA